MSFIVRFSGRSVHQMKCQVGGAAVVRQSVHLLWRPSVMLQHWSFPGPFLRILISSDMLFLPQCTAVLIGLCHFSLLIQNFQKWNKDVYLAFKWLHQNIYISVTFSKYSLSACVESSTEAGKEVVVHGDVFSSDLVLGIPSDQQRCPNHFTVPWSTEVHSVFWDVLASVGTYRQPRAGWGFVPLCV